MLAAAVGFGLYLSTLMAVPFLPALVFSFTLAVLSLPLDTRLRAWTGSPGLAATGTVAVVVFIVVIPALLVLTTLLGEAVKSAEVIGSLIDAETWRGIGEANPRLAPVLGWIDAKVDLPALVQSGTAWLTTWSGSVLKGSAAGAINLLLTFYFLFYMLRDRAAAIAAVGNLLPLEDVEYAAVRRRVFDTIHATVYGTVVVATLQGALGGLMFWWLGLPAPVFWGILMGALAVIPFLGAFVVWAPVAAYLALTGAFGSAALLAIWGTVVVGLVDNVVFPMLVGWRLMLHTVPSFISIAGGLLVFGAPGIILGPVIATVSVALLAILRERVLVAP
ncbi:AI-2E family transporter [Chthonobacter albigriseus]|uniref:AI-2E family transporter n=1 Tax=Chthonobacter albigriseus TaxID=1683161 RepID=UPI0015EEAB70|nr:AI-2E family transporter [Chthonobacter albigriseus]